MNYTNRRNSRFHRSLQLIFGFRLLEGILASAKQMKSMIEEVPHYSKAGQIQARHSVLDMSALLENLKQQLLVTCEQIALTINIGLSPYSKTFASISIKKRHEAT